MKARIRGVFVLLISVFGLSACGDCHIAEPCEDEPEPTIYSTA